MFLLQPAPASPFSNPQPSLKPGQMLSLKPGQMLSPRLVIGECWKVLYCVCGNPAWDQSDAM